MKKVSIIFTVIIFVFAFACNNSENNNNEEKVDSIAENVDQVTKDDVPTEPEEVDLSTPCPEEFSLEIEGGNIKAGAFNFTNSYAMFNDQDDDSKSILIIFTNYDRDEKPFSDGLEKGNIKVVLTLRNQDGSKMTPGKYSADTSGEQFACDGIIFTDKGKVYMNSTMTSPEIGKITINKLVRGDVCGSVDLKVAKDGVNDTNVMIKGAFKVTDTKEF